MIADKDLVSIQHARILAENAFEAQKRLAEFSQEKLDAIVEGVAGAALSHADALALMSHEETEYGNQRDKCFKNSFVCGRVAEALRGMRCVGVINEDQPAGVMEVGAPMGVIAALCPSTSPVSTMIYKTLLAIKSGNAIIFSPHPRALESMGAALKIMNEAAVAHGLPEGCLAALNPVTGEGTLALMNHAAVSIIMITGVDKMFRAARASGKPVIYGATGNGPAFVERTADLGRAVADIIKSKTFDNGIAPAAEQSLVIDAVVAAEVKERLRAGGAYFMSEKESLALAALFCRSDGGRVNLAVGLPAATLARRAGFSVPENTTLLIAERRYVCADDPYVGELLAPVLPCYVEDDWRHACEKCLELLLRARKAHTMSIHSRDEEVIRQFALKKPVSRLLVNTPAALGGMGATTNLFPAMTLGGWNSGFTVDNVSPLHLIRVRRVGRGGMPEMAGHGGMPENERAKDFAGRKKLALHLVLSEAARVLGDN